MIEGRGLERGGSRERACALPRVSGLRLRLRPLRRVVQETTRAHP